MKRKIIYGLGAILVATATLGAVANGPYYAFPAWAQKLVCTTTSNCPRFIVLADWNSQAVLDRETGLVWQQSPSSGPVNFETASGRCLNQATGSRAGWRLPTVNEFGSLFDLSVTTVPFLSPGHPFTVPPIEAQFWTLTPSGSGSESRHHTVEYDIGPFSTHILSLALNTLDSTPVSNVWCVRGGLFDGRQ